MAFKMKGWSAFDKEVDPTKIPPVDPVPTTEKIEKVDRPRLGLGTRAEKDDYTEEELATGMGGATDFYGTKKVPGSKIQIKRTGKHKKKFLSKFGKYKDGEAVRRLKISTTPKSKEKKAAKTNIFTGRKSRKIGSENVQEHSLEQGRGNPRNYIFTGTDKKGEKVNPTKKRKVVFDPKTGTIHEKVKRKSGLGYKYTGRTLVDQDYIDAAKHHEKVRTTGAKYDY